MNTPQKFDENDWLGGDLQVDPAKLEAALQAPRPTGRTVQTKATKDLTQIIDKASPFFWPCAKCSGSGSFRGFSGRRLGTCKACKGKGGRMGPVTWAQKQEIDQKKAAHKAQELANKIVAFARDHSDAYGWIQAEKGRFEFAQGMNDALAQYGSLTDKQLAAIEKCIDSKNRLAAERAQREANAPTTDLTKLAAAFTMAHVAGLKKPKLRFEGFAVSEAPLTGRNAGALYVTGERSADDQYFGKIVGGKFLSTRDTPQAIVDAVVRVLQDPIAEAVAFGKKTGVCSCCGAELSNPESIARGIGPICAGKFGF